MQRSWILRVGLALLVFSAGCGSCVKDDPAPIPNITPMNTASVGVKGFKKPNTQYMIAEDASAAPSATTPPTP